jgi:hypothetical protein
MTEQNDEFDSSWKDIVETSFQDFILNIFRFLDWLMELPEGLKQAFRSELEQYEQEKKMPYMTSIEQMGREEEKQAIAFSLLRQNVAVEVIFQATGLTIAQLQ